MDFFLCTQFFFILLVLDFLVLKAHKESGKIKGLTCSLGQNSNTLVNIRLSRSQWKSSVGTKRRREIRHLFAAIIEYFFIYESKPNSHIHRTGAILKSKNTNDTMMLLFLLLYYCCLSALNRWIFCVFIWLCFFFGFRWQVEEKKRKKVGVVQKEVSLLRLLIRFCSIRRGFSGRHK